MAASRSCILTYHSIDGSGSRISIPRALFREHIRSLSGSGLRVAPLASVADSPGSVALTFDDGYTNFLTDALPILLDYQMMATVFPVSGYCGRGNDWDQWPRLQLMDWSQLREVTRAGISLGAHTVNHSDLTRLPPDEVRSELRDSREEIQQRVGVRVEAFAYPYGATSPEVCREVSREFRLACGTRMEFLDQRSPLMNLPRIDARYFGSGFTMKLLGNLAGRALVGAQRWRSLMTR